MANALTKEARNLLITKFERVYLQLSPDDQARNSVTLRLADLLAERARIAAMEELETGCVDCQAGYEDRKRAIELYQEALPKVAKSKRAQILAQMGHLLELTNRGAEAEQLYKQIIEKEQDPQFVAEAKLSLAEMFFKSRQYQAAHDYYTQVLQEPEAKRKPLAAYRQAWCLFNLSKVEEAIAKIEHILNTPSLLTKGAEGSVSVDEQYKAEVAKDFSTFIAKKGATLEDIHKVYNLSPEKSKMLNVSYLASELERLGQNKLAISAYEFVLNKEQEPKERLLYHIKLAQLMRDQKEIKSSLENYKQAVYLQSSAICQNSCDENKLLLRKYVLDWNRAEKRMPTVSLLSAYDIYLDKFPYEVDMALWRIEVLKAHKSWNKVFGALNAIFQIYQQQKPVKVVDSKSV
ncbi:MAG: hypothetical protein KDD40_12575, partial [Bdellovibrionales bacterium]|nr:hypothetical protein [Bdellovibrionales bacterium]